MRIDDKLYQILGLPDFSSIEEIKKVYRKLAMEHHPDRGGDAEIMKRINLAYNILSKEKEQYDSWLHNVRDIQRPVVRVVVQSYGYWTTVATTDNTSTSGATGWW